MIINLAYGRSGLSVELPDHTIIIEPRFLPGLPDESAAIRDALRNPLGKPALKQLVSPQDTVAIVFSDITRPMPNHRVLPVLLDELAACGVKDQHVVLINALATHRRQTEDELAQMLGSELVERYEILQHDAWDQANLSPVCTNHTGRMVQVNRRYLEASVRILTGFIEPHFFAGFSGGPKAVLPGIADAESVIDNHDAAMIADSNANWAITETNPIWQEMVRIANATQPTFILNVTLNREKAITGVFAGDLIQAHRAGTEFVKRKAMQPVNQPFDVVITSNSGYPLDLNLYQAVKGMSAAAQIVREGGDIIIASECWDGVPEHGQYARLLREASSLKDLYDRIMSPGFRCQDQWQAQIQAKIQMKAHVHAYAGGLTEDQMRDAKVIPCRSIEDTLANILSRNPSATIAVLPEGPQTIPYLTEVQQAT